MRPRPKLPVAKRKPNQLYLEGCIPASVFVRSHV